MPNIFIVLVSIVAAFLPVIIAGMRSHKKVALINLLIMVGGFSMSLLSKTDMYVAIGQFFILWLAALLWSLSKDVETKYN